MSLEGNSYEAEHDLPPLVAAAVALAAQLEFPMSCTPGTGRLLRTLAAVAGSGARIGEMGTGSGVGAAWLASGMAEDATLTTIDPAADQVDAVAKLFADDARVRVRVGDWRGPADDGGFRLLFVDGGDGKTKHPDDVMAMVEPGGVVVLDDFTPTTEWPPMFQGEPD